MSEPLNLRELDQQLAGLMGDLKGNSLKDLMVTGGEVVQSRWRDNIQDAGLVRTGNYLDSIAVEVIDDEADFIRVQVGTDVRADDGVPYPVVLEYGSSDIFPHPVGIRAFDESRRRVVSDVSSGIDRKVRSRARK